MAKRSTSKNPRSPEEWQVTDEWGMADPDKAGMPALYKRLGHPVLHAALSTPRRERRRGERPERPADGVGLAIAEARRRAEQLVKPEFETIGQSPGRAMREAVRAQEAAASAIAHFVPDAAPVETTGVEPSTAAPAAHPATAAGVRKKRGLSRRLEARAAEPPAPASPVDARREPPEPVLPPAPAPPAPSARTARAVVTPEPERTRGRRPVSLRTRTSTAAATAPMPGKPMPPAPSPRRPRGAVPLAAWAHAVSDTPKSEPRRADPLGFWRTWFRIPPEVALVEYARGCRIQRLLIDAGEERASDFL